MAVGKPLALADGTLINPETGTPIEDGKPVIANGKDKIDDYIEIPSNINLQERIVDARRRLGDMPAPSASMNTFSIILAYSLYGLTDEDIATQTCLTVEQVQQIKLNDAFVEYEKELISGVLRADQDKVRGYFVKLSSAAAERIGGLINHPSATMQFAASKDVLDRAGHRPVDIVEHQHRMEAGLTIEVVTRDGKEVPMIDVTPEEIM